MPYSQDYTQITSGFVNYIGAAMNALPITEPRAKAQYIIDELMKQTILLSSQGQTEPVDMYTYKPVLRSVIYVLNQQKETMEKDLPYTKELIEIYTQATNALETVLQKIEKTDAAI